MSAWAQTDGPTDVAVSADRDVVIAVRAREEVTGNEVEDRFKSALESAGKTYQRIQARPIDIDAYEKIKEFLSTVESEQVEDLKQLVVRRSLRSNYWDISLPDGYNQVEQLVVTYETKDSSTPETTTLTPVSRSEGEKDPAVRLVYLGISAPQLELRADPSWKRLIKAEARLAAWGSNPAKTLTIQLETERCYRVLISGYRGTLRELFETLGDEDRVGLAMVGIQPPKSLALGIADFVRPIRGDYDEWIGNSLRMGLVPPVKPRVDRAWVLFPLSEKEAQSVKSQMESEIRNSGKTSRGLSEDLAKGTLLGYEVQNGLGGEKLADINVVPGDKPRWYLVQAKDEATPEFTRSFTISNVEGWQSTAMKDSVWRAVIFEFDVRGPDKVTRTGSKVVMPTKPSGEMGKGSLESHVHIQPVRGWSSGNSPLRAKKSNLQNATDAK